MRLQQFLAHAGIASRRKCETYISDGRVQVNGTVVTTLGTTVQPGRDVVLFDGKYVYFQDKRYICFYKPPHVMCTVNDPEGRKTVMDYFSAVDTRLYNVGRLDYNSEGVLFMTNDGELANALTHPSHEIKKTYYVICEGSLSTQDLDQLRDGIMLDEKKTYQATVSLKKTTNLRSEVFITIHEGRNRQIRRMLEAINHPVLFLRRESFANLTLEGLKKGQWRDLTQEELAEMRRLAGISR